MILDRKELLKKSDMSLASCVRNTSCSRGWLRLLTQIIFGFIIVSSFILILLMALNTSNKQEPEQQFCSTNQCRIVCHDVPFFNDREEHIVNAVSEAGAYCESIAVELNRPTFKHLTLPENWLSRMPSNVRELAIIGGNINSIAPHAFMTPFSNNLDVLILEELILVSWHTEMFLGLSNLRKLYIKNCMIGKIKSSALEPVDDTLKFLDIKASNSFDPTNITGSSSLILSEVDLSYNNFFDILGRDSFSKLQKCKVLFLNSCHITFIGKGTFDNLYSIQVLYLNNNFLSTIPVGLFDAILPYRPRIALQDNLWHCDCLNLGLRAVLRKGLLIIEPLCEYPEIMTGLTFSDFEGFCKTKSLDEDRSFNKNRSTTIFNNGVCKKRNSSSNNSNQFKIVSPLENHRCLLNRVKSLNLSVLSEKSYGLVSKISEWITPVFRIEQSTYSMVELEASDSPGLGLLWYASSCRTEVYCANVIPNVLKFFNIISGVKYTFCPFNISTATIYNADCVSYDLGEYQTKASYYYGAIILISICLGSLVFGAVCVYILILKKPTLLKANKRVLFVKHKSIQALILPPKVPLRKNKSNESDNIVQGFIEKENIFILPDLGLNSQNFIRSTSTTRSIVSNDGSYISALQPTEEQLKEWRSNQIVNQYDNASSSDYMSPFSSFYDEAVPYYTLHTHKEVYKVAPEY